MYRMAASYRGSLSTRIHQWSSEVLLIDDGWRSYIEFRVPVDAWSSKVGGLLTPKFMDPPPLEPRGDGEFTAVLDGELTAQAMEALDFRCAWLTRADIEVAGPAPRPQPELFVPLRPSRVLACSSVNWTRISSFLSRA